jgi:hypothetical protein
MSLCGPDPDQSPPFVLAIDGGVGVRAAVALARVRLTLALGWGMIVSNGARHTCPRRSLTI